LYSLLAKVVIYAKDVLFGKVFGQQAVKYPRRASVMAKRLFDHQATAVGGSRLCQPLRHSPEQARRDCEVMQWALCRTELRAQPGKRALVGVVAVDIAQQIQQPLYRGGVGSVVMLYAVERVRLELVKVPS